MNISRIEEELSEVHLRLAGVTLEHLPWQQFIKTWGKRGTFFFLDSPYYNHKFEITDFKKPAEALAGLKSHFLLSINDHPEMRKVFGGFTIKPVNLPIVQARRHNAGKLAQLFGGE